MNKRLYYLNLLSLLNEAAEVLNILELQEREKILLRIFGSLHLRERIITQLTIQSSLKVMGKLRSLALLNRCEFFANIT